MLNRLKTVLKAMWPVAVAVFRATNPQYAIPISVLDKTIQDAVKRLEDGKTDKI